MNRWRKSLASMLAVAWAASLGRGEEPLHFAIRMDGELVGYAAVQSQPAKWNGQDVEQLKCLTSFKVATLGKERQIVLDSETLLRPGGGTPLCYTLTYAANEAVGCVECEFAGGKARMWTHRKGEQKGDPKETTLPNQWAILGNNNFAHWRLLMKMAAANARGGKASILVFVPDAGHVETMEFVEGEKQDAEIRGTKKTCAVWRLQKQNINVLVNPGTNELLRMELPSQQTTIELADASVVKLAEKAAAPEVLGKHFVQTNVAFDDYLKVSSLKADIDVEVIGSGIENDVSVLTTAMQTFAGEKEGARIKGQVVIRTEPYDGKGAPPFPYDGPDRAKLAKWLRPSEHIESDHPSIAAKSKELTGGARDSWEAVLRTSEWVQKEIRYAIADTPSALLALEKRVGDCGPHATLTVAMLRAAGIPAKLVGGLLYTPTFGGAFGQHAWVEAYMGARGWTPLDPTTGENQQINAAHVKLFEGMGGVVPKSVTVVAFQPPNRKAAPAKPADLKPLPWKLGKQYTFRYSQSGQSLGSETFSISKVQLGGQEAHQMESALNLNAGGAVVQGSTTLVVAPGARPLSFQRSLDAAGRKVSIQCDFQHGAVKAKISGSVNLQRDVKLPTGAYCFDNNLMGSFALICSQLAYKVGQDVTVNTFHPSSLRLIPLTLKTKALNNIKIGDKELACYECDVSPIKNTFWVSSDGKFVRAQQGALVIELADAD